MTSEQIDFLKNMTNGQARALMAKFNDNPYEALDASEAAITAFMRAYEQVNPGEYIQRAQFASGTVFSIVYL